MPLYFWLILGVILYSIASSIFSKKTYTPSQKEQLQKCIKLYESHGYVVGIPDFTEVRLVISIPKTQEDIKANVYPVLIIKPDFYIKKRNENKFTYTTGSNHQDIVNRVYISVSDRKAYLPYRDTSINHFGVKEVPLPVPF